MKTLLLIFLSLLFSVLIFGQSNDDVVSKFWKAVENNDNDKVIKLGGQIINDNNYKKIRDSIFNKIIEETLLAYYNIREMEKAHELSIIYTEHSLKHFGNNSLEVGKGWQYQGISSAWLHQYDQAVNNLNNAISVYSNIQSDDPKYILDFIIQTKFNLGNILEKQQKYKEALSVFDDLQFHYESVELDSTELVRIYNYKVKINNELGNYNIALYFANLSLKLSSSLFPEVSEKIIESHNNLGQVHLSLGNYNEALLQNKITQDLIQKSIGRESLWYATSLANTAATLGLLGQNNEAYKLDSLSSDIILRKANPQSYEYIKACLKMGSQLPNTGNIEVPIQYLNLGLKSIRLTFEKGSNYEVEFLRELSYWQNLNNNSSDAMRNAKLSVKYAKKLFESDEDQGMLYHQNLSNLGQILIYNGKLEKGLEYKFQSLHYFVEKFGIRSQLSLNNFDYILNASKKMEDHDFLRDYWNFVIDLKFLNFYENSIGLSENEKLKYKLSINADLEEYLSYLTYYNIDSLMPPAYTTYLNAKGFVGSDKRLVFDLAKNSDDKVLKEYYDKWVLFNNELNSIYEGRNPRLGFEIFELKDLITTTEQFMSWSFSSKVDLNSLIKSSQISNELAKKEVFVDIARIPHYSLYSNKWIDSVKYLVFISNNKDTLVDYLFIDYGESLENEVVSHYTSYASGSNKTSEAKDELSYEYFWKPIADKIGDAKTVYISLGGVYNNINLNTLYNTETGKYLLEEKDIRMVNSARDFVLMKERKKKTYASNTAALFGYPNYDGAASAPTDSLDYLASTRDLDPIWVDSLTRGGLKAALLPATKVEVENISLTFTENNWQVSSYLDNDASETNIKQLESPRVLHIATHGYFFEDVPDDLSNDRFMGIDRKQVVQNPLLRSGLLFTGANKTLQGDDIQGENGLLSAYESALLNLRETELVVLSACETGRGEINNSEGVYGLRKAISDAGAANTIMSLWKVDDKVTQEFMSAFYSTWLSGKTIRKAFNETQLAIKAKYPQPYYWGAFVLVGE